ncbi:hypothetical protein F4604DRAFT_1680829 [Suillus subluteus]|nr:hypothetical protein F4604DRAFT_1680829 [Suillus subluteus]
MPQTVPFGLSHGGVLDDAENSWGKGSWARKMPPQAQQKCPASAISLFRDVGEVESNDMLNVEVIRDNDIGIVILFFRTLLDSVMVEGAGGNAVVTWHQLLPMPMPMPIVVTIVILILILL